MTSELRPAVAVAEDCHWEYEFKSEEEAAAVIEADREAVRAEQAAELAKFKALAEKLAGALGEMRSYGCPVCNGDCGSANPPVMSCPMSQSCEALRQYKEARDAS